MFSWEQKLVGDNSEVDSFSDIDQQDFEDDNYHDTDWYINIIFYNISVPIVWKI